MNNGDDSFFIVRCCSQLNIFLAILVDAYSKVKEKAMDSGTEAAQDAFDVSPALVGLGKHNDHIHTYIHTYGLTRFLFVTLRIKVCHLR